MIYFIIATILVVNGTEERKQITTTKSWSEHGIFSCVLNLFTAKIQKMENNGGGRGPPDDRNKQPKNVGKLLHMCLEAQSGSQQEENHVVQPMPEEVNITCVQHVSICMI